MGPANWTTLLLLFQLLLAHALSSSVVDHLEPVLRARMDFKEEPALLRKRREENHQPFPSSLSLGFEAFGTPFTFELDVHRQVTEGAKMALFDNGVLLEERPFEHLVYRGEKLNELGEQIGWINLVVHGDGLFNALIFADGEMFAVDPLEHHEEDLDAVTKRDLESLSDLVIYKTSEMKLEDKRCGNISPKRARSNDTRTDFQETITTSHPLGRVGRNLQTVARWTSCFPNDAVTRSFSVAFYVDYGYYGAVGGTAAKAQANLLTIFSNANMVYYTQANVWLKIGATTVQTAANGDAFNQASTGCIDIDTTLKNFRAWRSAPPQSSNNFDGTYHLLTNCYTSGTVGLAYVGVLCDKTYGAGVSGNTKGSTWITFAHELGHNFGANHAFQEGQGTTGGIMDYGDGKLNGEYQFNSKYNKDEVCNQITASMARSDTGAVNSCWTTFSSVCGNGIIEPGEDCDDATSCCVACKFAPGAICSGPCCQTPTCQYAPNTVTCGDQSFCANGVCTLSACTQFSNLAFCAFSSPNLCLTNCIYNGGDCLPSTSFPTFPNRYLANGTVCSSSPYSTCQNGACVPATFAWSIGAWSTCALVCGDETKTRTVQCKRSDGTVAADSSCAGAKPATSQSCGNPTCASSTFTWAKASGPCSSTTCNVAGTITNTITCQVNGTRTVPDSYCTTYATSPRPAASAACLGTCSGTWFTGPWGTCSLLCGPETQNRTVECRNSTGSAVAASSCNGTKPEASRSCNNPSCASSTFTWAKASGPCSSTTCNAPGTITITITCQVNGTATVPDFYCTTYATSPRPNDTESCEGPCNTYSWASTGTWGPCSATECGEDGTQDQLYECHDQDGHVVSDTLCTTPTPQGTRPCQGICSAAAGGFLIPIIAGAAGGAVLLIAIVAGLLVFFAYRNRPAGSPRFSSLSNALSDLRASSINLKLSTPSIFGDAQNSPPPPYAPPRPLGALPTPPVASRPPPPTDSLPLPPVAPKPASAPKPAPPVASRPLAPPAASRPLSPPVASRPLSPPAASRPLAPSASSPAPPVASRPLAPPLPPKPKTKPGSY